MIGLVDMTEIEIPEAEYNLFKVEAEKVGKTVDEWVNDVLKESLTALGLL